MIKYETLSMRQAILFNDSNLVINFEDSEQINYYVDRFMKILKINYYTFHLKMNPEKTQIMTICKERRKHELMK